MLNTDRLGDEREKGETFALMARANGRGRLIPTPALSKIMLHRAAGGLGGPLLKTVYCIYTINPQQSQSQSYTIVYALPGRATVAQFPGEDMFYSQTMSTMDGTVAVQRKQTLPILRCKSSVAMVSDWDEEDAFPSRIS